MVISKKPLNVIVAFALAIIPLFGLANSPVESTALLQKKELVHLEESPVKKALSQKEKVNAYVLHHLQDSYDFVLFSDEKAGTHFGFSLPVILIDNGFKFFSASKFHHGESVAEVDGSFYAMSHGKIYKTDATGDLKLDAHHHPTVAMPLDFSITKNVFSLLVTALIIFLLFFGLAKTYKTSHNNLPKGFNRVLEPLVIYVRDEIARPNIGEKKYKKFMPYLLTVFFLIWLLNLIGLTPLGINVTGNIAVTMCLAIFTFIITQFSGNKDYWAHIFWMPGVPVPMKIILGPIEVLGMFTKPFSLMIRLFANITAGHTVVMGLIAIIFIMKEQLTTVGATTVSLALTLFISVIEILVAFLQAYIFTMLSSLFIGMAVQEHHHDEHHNADAHGDHDNAIV